MAPRKGKRQKGENELKKKTTAMAPDGGEPGKTGERGCPRGIKNKQQVGGEKRGGTKTGEGDMGVPESGPSKFGPQIKARMAPSQGRENGVKKTKVS